MIFFRKGVRSVDKKGVSALRPPRVIAWLELMVDRDG